MLPHNHFCVLGFLLNLDACSLAPVAPELLLYSRCLNLRVFDANPTKRRVSSDVVQIRRLSCSGESGMIGLQSSPNSENQGSFIPVATRTAARAREQVPVQLSLHAFMCSRRDSSSRKASPGRAHRNALHTLSSCHRVSLACVQLRL